MDAQALRSRLFDAAYARPRVPPHRAKTNAVPGPLFDALVVGVTVVLAVMYFAA